MLSKRVKFLRKFSLILPIGRLMLGHDQLGDPRLVIRVVILGAMKKQDDIRNGFNRVRRTEVGQVGVVVFTIFDGAADLGQDDDRNTDLASNAFELPHHHGDLFRAAIRSYLQRGPTG